MSASGSLRHRLARFPLGVYRATPGPEARFLDANPALAHLLGAGSVDGLLAHSPADFYLNPDHRAGFHQRILEHGGATQELYLLTLDGRFLWAVDNAQLWEDPEQGPVIEGSLEEVTASRLAERRLALATEAGSFGVFELDLASGLLQVDDRILELYGLGLQEHLASYEQWRALVHPADIQGVEREIRDAYGRQDRWDVTFRIVRPDGETRWIRSLGRQLLDASGLALRQVGINEDVTTWQAIQERLTQLAAQDPLTGLINRRKMREQLAAALAAFERHGMPFAVIYFDIDFFKRFNDAYGHESGDRALRELAGQVSACLRQEDSVARWGGEEFLILATHTTLEGGCQLAERVRAVVEGEAHGPDGQVPVTISAGVAEIEAGLTVEMLESRADQALYAAKSAGRNQVCTWGGG